MNHTLKTELLSKEGKTYKHTRQAVLPFITREPERVKFTNDFSRITAEFIRLILRISTPDETKMEEIIAGTLAKITFGTAADKENVKMYLKTALNQQNKTGDLTNITNIPLSTDNTKKGEKEIAHFLYDVFVRSHRTELDELLLQLEDAKNIFSNLVGTVSKEQEKNTTEIKAKYKVFSETFTATFMQDFKAILAKQSDLLANLNALLSHYYFVATTQLILSLDKKAAFNPHQFTKVVYLLTTEKASQSRDSYLFGMKDISKKLKYTITHDHILYILNTNNFSTLSETQTYWDYLDFKNYFKDQGPQVEAEFVVSVMAWLRDYYCVKNKIAYTAAHANVETFSECIAYMHDMIQYSWSTDPTNRTKPDAVHSRYPKNYTDFQKAFFRKNAGSLGQLIALPQNYLLLLTGLSVGEEPLLVSDLWLELEKRGVWLDYQSKNEVVNLLTKLNYIDKKSDSGDAQYVKRIL